MSVVNVIMMPDHHQFDIEHTKDHVCVRFTKERFVLSSALLNGGFLAASNILIMKVPKHVAGGQPKFDDPENTLSKYCEKLGLNDTTVGMMTAASMNSYRMALKSSQGVEVAAMVTAGISNARSAGDVADWRAFDTNDAFAGTINIVLITNAKLTQAAMVEALSVATEAKTVALRSLGVKSPVSGLAATGTGTDAIAIAVGIGPVSIRYSGKHVLFGEMIATTVIEALRDSLRND